MVEHIWREHGDDTEILFGPDMWLGAFVEKATGRRLTGWMGECHAGIRPGDLEQVRAEHPGSELLVHPECGCTTSVLEYLESGDADATDAHLLGTAGILKTRASRAPRRSSSPPRPACSTRAASRTSCRPTARRSAAS